MNCPIDGSQLVMAERQGVEIDYCPQCRGVWLDRGELDKIIERGSNEFAGPPRDERREMHPSGHKPKKKKNFLSEIFEFGE
jgi:Zn-finger nucleic acid-binding protein